jgi:hypothetical protein
LARVYAAVFDMSKPAGAKEEKSWAKALSDSLPNPSDKAAFKAFCINKIQTTISNEIHSDVWSVELKTGVHPLKLLDEVLAEISMEMEKYFSFFPQALTIPRFGHVIGYTVEIHRNMDPNDPIAALLRDTMKRRDYAKHLENIAKSL